jgi:hypothetical protein
MPSTSPRQRSPPAGGGSHPARTATTQNPAVIAPARRVRRASRSIRACGPHPIAQPVEAQDSYSYGRVQGGALPLVTGLQSQAQQSANSYPWRPRSSVVTSTNATLCTSSQLQENWAVGVGVPRARRLVWASRRAGMSEVCQDRLGEAVHLLAVMFATLPAEGLSGPGGRTSARRGGCRGHRATVRLASRIRWRARRYSP